MDGRKGDNMFSTKRVYISGRIKGTDDYLKRFEKAEEKIFDAGLIAVNPARVNAQLPECTSEEEYMRMSICMLDMCDAIYLLHGWEESTEASRDFGYAMARGMDVLKEAEPDEKKKQEKDDTHRLRNNGGTI